MVHPIYKKYIVELQIPKRDINIPFTVHVNNAMKFAKREYTRIQNFTIYI